MLEQQLPECFYRVSMKGLILNEEGKFLLCREVSNLWGIPGGGLDRGETPEIGLAREIHEEMGLETTWIADTPSFFFTTQALQKEWWLGIVVYEVTVDGYDIIPSDECQEIGWFTAEEVLERRDEMYSDSILLAEEYIKKGL